MIKNHFLQLLFVNEGGETKALKGIFWIGGECLEDDTKKRIPVWLYPKTLKRMDECLDLGNCKSRSEYIENAVSFYNGYLLSKESSPYLPVILTSAMSGIVEASENRTSRLLFKLAVELSMLMNLYAAQSDVGEEILEKLRGKCIQDVKHTNGSVNLESVMAYQKGK